MADPITTMNISVPKSMRDFVKERMDQGGFANTSEYVRHLIREDRARAAKEHIQTQLQEGLDSPASQLTKDDWATLRREVTKSLNRGRRKSA